MGLRATRKHTARPTQRQGVIAPAEQAKMRLRAALKPDINRKRVKRDNLILLQLIVPILLPFAAAALFALYPPRIPGVGADWQAWLDPAFFALVALGVLGVFIARVNRVLTQWDHSHPDSPAEAIGEFYRQANRRRPSAKRMGTLIAAFDEPGPRIRPVFSWLTATAVPDVDSPRTVARYWWALLHGNKELSRRVRVLESEFESPLPDVSVARLKLRVVTERKLQAMLSLVGGLVVMMLPFALGEEFLQRFGFTFWTGAGAAIALGIGVVFLLRKLSKAVAERREPEVSKLLVRTSHNWRLVSGEWESEDESDLGWMQSFTP